MSFQLYQERKIGTDHHPEGGTGTSGKLYEAFQPTVSSRWNPRQHRLYESRSSPRKSMSGAHLVQHVIDDLPVLFLRAEQDDLGIFGDLYRVSGRPVEQVTAIVQFPGAVKKGNACSGTKSWAYFPLKSLKAAGTLRPGCTHPKRA